MVDTNGYHKCTYDDLKELVRDESIDRSRLTKLKDLFASDIDSVRRLDSIRSIKDLIDCLERRDVLNECNIDALRTIADTMDSSKIQTAVASYVTPKEIAITTEPINYYREKRLANKLRESPNISSFSSGSSSYLSSSCCQKANATQVQNFTEKQRQAIYKLLSREIGSNWRFFGRELEVGEGEMDVIELQFPKDLPSRIFKLMQLSIEDRFPEDSKRQAECLGNALDACGRKDLRRKVIQIMNE